MKKNIGHIVIFLLILVAILYAIQYAIDLSYKKRVSNKFTRILKHDVDSEIMVFGSSIVYHQFDPGVILEETGYSAYNMGFPGMFFTQYNGLIKEYLTYQKHCKVIVIGCDFDNLGKTGLVTRPDLFYAYLDNRNIYNALSDIEPKKTFHARYLPGYKLTLLNKAFYTDILLARPLKDSLSGFEPLSINWESARDRKPFNARYDEGVFEQLKVTLEAISKQNIKVVLVIPPVYQEGYHLIQNADFIKSKYRSLVGMNVFFVDYTYDSICRNKENFHNFTHLNLNGANRFSHTFAKDLLRIIHE